MERANVVILATLSLLAVLIANCPVEGKCRGSWSNHHACFGANGKRAYPSATAQDSLLLRKMLEPKRDVMTSEDDDSAYLPSAAIDDRDAGFGDTRMKSASDYYPSADNMAAAYGEREELANYLQEMLQRLKNKNANK